ERAADREHLLLAAGEHAAGIVGALPQHRKQGEHVVHRPASRAPRVLHAEEQVLADAEGGKDVAVLGDVAEALARDDVGRQRTDLRVAEANGAGGVDVAHDRPDGRRAPDTVAPEQADDLAVPDGQGHAVQDVALAVERVQVRDGEHQATLCGVPRYASCTAALARMRSGVSWAMTSP